MTGGFGQFADTKVLLSVGINPLAHHLGPPTPGLRLFDDECKCWVKLTVEYVPTPWALLAAVLPEMPIKKQCQVMQSSGPTLSRGTWGGVSGKLIRILRVEFRAVSIMLRTTALSRYIPRGEYDAI